MSASKNIAAAAKALLDVECFVEGKSTTLDNACDLIVRTLIKRHGAWTWLFGNGGSGTVADHIACDLVLAGYSAQALTNSALVTTFANDFGLEFAFSKQLGRFARPGDILVAMSCSGESRNIIAALESQRFAFKVLLTGFDRENAMVKSPADVLFFVPSREYGAVQIAHLAILHAIVDALKGEH